MHSTTEAPFDEASIALLADRRLTRFQATATERFETAPAALFIGKAHHIASSLQLALFHPLGAPPDGLVPGVVPAGRS